MLDIFATYNYTESMQNQPKYKLIHCLYLPTHDKFWGVLVLNDINAVKTSGRNFHKYFWCWWAQRGKSISVKKHLYNIYLISKYEKQKINNKYEPITTDKLLEMWPEFYNQLECKMLFEALKDD